jgi:hypothetical protein
MKQITNKTVLKQGYKTYQPIEIDGVIYWVDKREILPNTWYENSGVLFLSDSVYNKGNNPNNSNPIVTDFNRSIVAQSEPRLDNIPVVSLDNYVKELAKGKWGNVHRTGVLGFIEGFKSNPNQYTQADIERAIQLAREADSVDGVVDLDVVLSYGNNNDLRTRLTRGEILEEINSISVIEVDERFNVISYDN